MRKTSLFFAIILFSSFSQPDLKFWNAGEALIKNLKQKSPKFEDNAMRGYLYQDLDYDSKYEIIEKQNKIEEDAPGFLNGELYPAFELHRIFTFKGDKFQRDYSKFQSYLEERLVFYKFWKKQIQNPAYLSEESQELIKANKTLFIKELDRLIVLTESLIKY